MKKINFLPTDYFIEKNRDFESNKDVEYIVSRSFPRRFSRFEPFIDSHDPAIALSIILGCVGNANHDSIVIMEIVSVIRRGGR